MNQLPNSLSCSLESPYPPNTTRGARALSWDAQRNELTSAMDPKDKGQIPRGSHTEQTPASNGKLTQRVKGAVSRCREMRPIVFRSSLSNKGKNQPGMVDELPHQHHPGLLEHLYPLTRRFRKFSSKPVLLEILEAKLTASQSITDEQCSHRIFSGGHLAQACPKA